MKRKKMVKVRMQNVLRMLTIAIAILLAFITGFAQTPAFPTAEGYGKWASGGRGGAVVEVTKSCCNAFEVCLNSQV